MSPPLLEPHFIDATTNPLLLAAAEELSDSPAADLYARFLQAREVAIIEEIRPACGISASSTELAEDLEPDEVAADVKDVKLGVSPPEDETEDPEPSD